MTIVLGVLVALGVDEWRENRAELRQEVEYYRSLVEDLDRDIAEYEYARDFTAVSVRAAQQVLGAITGVPVANPFATLAEGVHYASWVNYPSWSSGTLDELVNSGRIRLLRNQSLKRDVLAYYDGIAEWKPRLQGPEFAAFIEYRRVTAAWLPLNSDAWNLDRSAPAPEEWAAFGQELEGRLRANEQMLGLVQEMLWEWQGLDQFMVEFHHEAWSLRERLQAELASR
ncbi:MAG: hypothetical protein WEA09_08755 [Gemmatimonadota bacterium]